MANIVSLARLRGRNFLRFGQGGFDISFKNGLTGIFGENGLGKSAILDGIAICSFNEGYRESNKADWVNNINKKGLYLNLEVHVESPTGLDVFELIQDHSTSKVSEHRIITKNGERILDVANIQEYIEQRILGFNLNLFRNSIAVSAGTPFISMTPEQKRNFSDNLFSIKQVRLYKKHASEALSDVNTTKMIVVRDITNSKNKIREYTDIIAAATQDSDSITASIYREIQLKEADLARFNDDVTSLLEVYNLKEAELIEVRSKIKSETELYNSFNVNTLNSSIRDLETALSICKNDYGRISGNIKKIIPNVPCFECGNSFTEDTASEHIAKHNVNLSAIAEKGRTVKAELEIAKAKLAETTIVSDRIRVLNGNENTLSRECSSITSNISNVRYNIQRTSSSIESSRNTINEIVNRNVNTSVISSAKDAIVKCEEAIISLTLELGTLDRKIAAYEYIIEMCSDSGVKSMLLKKFVPILNKFIKYYMSAFQLPVTVEFDDLFKHKLISEPGVGHKHSLLSKGQRKRIDIAILFAMVDLIKIMGNFKCNLLILDEFADDGLDSRGFSDIITLIKNICDRDSKSIAIVSHKNDDVLYDNLDHMYMLSGDANFSSLEEVDVKSISR